MNNIKKFIALIVVKLTFIGAGAGFVYLLLNNLAALTGILTGIAIFGLLTVIVWAFCQVFNDETK